MSPPLFVGGMMRDLVYLVRSGENEELRYSLRSVEKHASGLFRDVWVVGVDLPDWLTGVNVLPVPDSRNKHQTMRDKIRALCEVDAVSDEFILMNDDYFLTKPISEWVVYHMGPASAWLRRKIDAAVRHGGVTSYLRDVRTTCKWMAEHGYGDVLVRETHSPTIWDKTRLARVLDDYPPVQPVTVVDLYDAAGCGGVGEFALNAKVHTDEQFDVWAGDGSNPWVSSSDVSFAETKVGEFVRGMFSEPSRWEAA